MTHVTNKSWTDKDIARLRQLSIEGSSINRAAAALGRRTEAVRKQCRVHGITLVGTREAKAAIRKLYEHETAALAARRSRPTSA